MKVFRLNFKPLNFWFILFVFIIIFGFSNIIKVFFWLFIAIFVFLPILIYLAIKLFKIYMRSNNSTNRHNQFKSKRTELDNNVIDIKAKRK